MSDNTAVNYDELPDTGAFPDEIGEDFTRLPVGTILWKVSDTIEELAGKGKDRKCIRAELTAMAPIEAIGKEHTRHFWIGTRKDPGASKVGTWMKSPDLRNFKVMANKAGVLQVEKKARPLIYSELKGREVVGRVEYERASETLGDGSPNPNAGKSYARINEWFLKGEIPLETKPAPELGRRGDGAGATAGTGSVPPPPSSRAAQAQAAAGPPPPPTKPG